MSSKKKLIVGRGSRMCIYIWKLNENNLVKELEGQTNGLENIKSKAS